MTELSEPAKLDDIEKIDGQKSILLIVSNRPNPSNWSSSKLVSETKIASNQHPKK